jgi:hypothetical protein
MSQASGKDKETSDGPAVDLVSLSQSSSARSLKKDAILQACHDRDIAKLVRLTETAGGLLEDSLRQPACKCCVLSTVVLRTNAAGKGPILLGCEQPLPTADMRDPLWKALPRHRDEDQVQLDVNRAFAYYPNGN